MSTHLFTAHDNNLITLPTAVLQVRTGLSRATQHLRDLQAPPHALNVRDEVTTATVAAFLSGEPLPTLDAVLDAELATRTFEHRLEVARNVVSALDHQLIASIVESAEEILTAALRPALETLVSELRDAFTLLEPFEQASRGALALANTKVRSAAGTADKGRDTYTLLTRAAQEVRKLAPPPVHDVDNEFASWRDIYKVWPRERRTNFGAVPAPWDKAPDPLAWQLRNLTAWLPTAAEQDAAWLEVYGKAAREQQVTQEKRRAMALSFGQGH